MSIDSPFMTPREVMDFLRIGKTTVFDLFKSKEIETTQVRRKRLAYRASVIAFARRNDRRSGPLLDYPKHGVGRMIRPR
jgi:excisionase family DNA binding protein